MFWGRSAVENRTVGELCGSVMLLIPRGLPDIRRRGAVEPSKAAVEIRKVAKANVIGNRAHLPLQGLRSAEHAIGAGEAPAEQKFGKRGAIALTQSLQIARGHAETGRDNADRHIPAADISDDMGLCCS